MRPGLAVIERAGAGHLHQFIAKKFRRRQRLGLAQRMRMDRATTMAIVNRLEARDLLVRGQSPTDGRKQTLNLTDTGRQMLHTAKEAIREHEHWLKSRFTPKEVAHLIEMLSRIHE